MKISIFFASASLALLTSCGRPPPQPPILAKSDIYVYGKIRISYEGKIYNPNPYGLRDVRVVWSVYPKMTQSWADRFYGDGFEDRCVVTFAYIPAKTSFDFASNRIRIRDEETMAAWGAEETQPSPHAPEITFTPES